MDEKEPTNERKNFNSPQSEALLGIAKECDLHGVEEMLSEGGLDLAMALAAELLADKGIDPIALFKEKGVME